MKKTNYMKLSGTCAELVVASTLALSLVSCSDQTEGTSTAMDNEIQITAMMGSEAVTSKALTSDTLTTDNIKAFYMNAYEGATQVIAITKDGDTYSKGKFTPTGTDGKWSDGSLYYWPASNVKFMAIACSDGTEPDIDITSEKLSMTDFQVEDASSSSYKTQKDYVAAVTTQGASTSHEVALHFQHLLSRLSINMWAPSDKFTHTSKLEAVGFCFKNVNVKGSFSYTGSSTASSSDDFTANFKTSNWTPDATAGSGKVGVADADVWGLAANISKATELQNKNDKLSDATPWLNVIPGSNVADSLVVYVKLTPTDTSKPAYYKSISLNDIAASVITTSDDDASTPAYLPGYQYIYNLKVLGQDNTEGEVENATIELENVTVKPWNTKVAGEAATDNVGDNTLVGLFEHAENYAQINLNKNDTLKGNKEANYNKYNYNYPIVVTGSHTLNLNGDTLLVANPVEGEYTGDVTSKVPSSVFVIKNGARLVITDLSSKQTGFFTNKSEKVTQIFEIEAAADGKTAGVVIIRGGKYAFNPSAYIEGTPDNDAFSETVTTKTFTENYTDDSTGKAMVRTTVVTLASGVYAVSQTITNKE